MNAQNQKETPNEGLVWNADKTAAYFGPPWNKGEKPMFCVTGDKKEIGISWPFNCDELHFGKKEALALAEAINHFMGGPKGMAFPVDLSKDSTLQVAAESASSSSKYPLQFLDGVQWMLDQIHAAKPKHQYKELVYEIIDIEVKNQKFSLIQGNGNTLTITSDADGDSHLDGPGLFKFAEDMRNFLNRA